MKAMRTSVIKYKPLYSLLPKIKLEGNLPVKFRLVFLFLTIIIFCLTIISEIPAFSNGRQGNEIYDSVQSFITQMYEDIGTGDDAILNRYSFEEWRAKDAMRQMLLVTREYKNLISRMEILELIILSKEPPIKVEVLVREWNNPEYYPPPYFDRIFVLKEIGKLKWGIVDITEPGL